MTGKLLSTPKRTKPVGYIHVGYRMPSYRTDPHHRYVAMGDVRMFSFAPGDEPRYVAHGRTRQEAAHRIKMILRFHYGMDTFAEIPMDGCRD